MPAYTVTVWSVIVSDLFPASTSIQLFGLFPMDVGKGIVFLSFLSSGWNNTVAFRTSFLLLVFCLQTFRVGHLQIFACDVWVYFFNRFSACSFHRLDENPLRTVYISKQGVLGPLLAQLLNIYFQSTWRKLGFPVCSSFIVICSQHI